LPEQIRGHHRAEDEGKRVRLSLCCAIAGAFALKSVVAGASDITGQVTAVDSGDTLKLVDGNGRQLVVRLSDIGSPQGSTYFARGARQLLTNIVQGETVRVAITGEDGTGRVFGHVYRGLLDVNLELVKAGAAWLCIEYAGNTSYLPWQNQAIRAHRGLWSQTTTFEALIACRQHPPASSKAP